jgi:hypothetical protein
MNKIFKFVGIVVVILILTLSVNTQPAAAVVGPDSVGDPPRCCMNPLCWECDICYAGTTTCVGVLSCHCGQN